MNTKLIAGVVVLLGIFVLGGTLFLRESEAPMRDNGQNETTQKEDLDSNSEVKDTSVLGQDEVVDTMIEAVKHEVSYIDDGFAPQTIEIKKGETVTFTNQSSRGMRVASAVHPTHAVYPEKSSDDCSGSSFDACAQISSGENWSFTFSEVGSWKYHNHVNTGHVGTIVVR